MYLTIKEASKILGVSPLTLRNWDKNGKLKALRHPMNNYRVYKKEDIEAVIKDMESGVAPKKSAPKGFKKIVVQHLTD